MAAVHTPGNSSDTRSLVVGQIEACRALLRQSVEPFLQDPYPMKPETRVDPEEFLQSELVNLAARIPAALSRNEVPVFSYLRSRLHKRITDRLFPVRNSEKRCLTAHRIEHAEAVAEDTKRLQRAWISVYGTPRLEQLAGQVDPLVQVESLLDALPQLGANDRDPVLLRWCENLEVDQIARVMELSVNIVSRRIQRGLTRLREQLLPRD